MIYLFLLPSSNPSPLQQLKVGGEKEGKRGKKRGGGGNWN